jgi:ribosomal protein S18 acetylase RimI-like enzyme
MKNISPNINEVCLIKNEDNNQLNQSKDNVSLGLSCSNFSMLESFNQFQENNLLFCTQPTMPKLEHEMVFTTKFNYKMFQIMKNHFSTLFKLKYNDDFFQNIYNHKYFTIFGIEKHSNEIMCFANILIERNIAQILTLAVIKEYQNKKVGTKLLRKIIEELTLKGISEVILIVQTINIPAIKLYQKLGFIISYNLPNYYIFENPAENDAYEMKKILKISGFWIFDIFKLVSKKILPDCR